MQSEYKSIKSRGLTVELKHRAAELKDGSGFDKTIPANDPVFAPEDAPKAEPKPSAGHSCASKLTAAAAAALLCLTLSGCELNSMGAEEKPGFNYEAAVTYFIPELKRHTAFGTDTLKLKSLDEDEDPKLMQAAAAALRLNGAGVTLVDDEQEGKLKESKEMRELAAAQQAGLAPVHERTLWVKKNIMDETLLVTLALDDTILYCTFINFKGELVPSSALSIARGEVYGS